jgi:hypothetical protein
MESQVTDKFTVEDDDTERYKITRKTLKMNKRSYWESEINPNQLDDANRLAVH